MVRKGAFFAWFLMDLENRREGFLVSGGLKLPLYFYHLKVFLNKKVRSDDF